MNNFTRDSVNKYLPTMDRLMRIRKKFSMTGKKKYREYTLPNGCILTKKLIDDTIAERNGLTSAEMKLIKKDRIAEDMFNGLNTAIIPTTNGKKVYNGRDFADKMATLLYKLGYKKIAREYFNTELWFDFL